MENGYGKLEEEDKEESSSSSSSLVTGPPLLSWKRKLDCLTTLLPEFSFKIGELLHLMPLGLRLQMHIKKEAAKGTPSVSDPNHKRLNTSYHGIPLGGIGCGSIGRSFRGEFQRFQIMSRSCEDAPMLANQFSVFISRGNTGTTSTVLCSTRPKTTVLCNDKRGSGISSWDWDLDGGKCTYHALYPRAWTEYNGTPDPEITCRQISPFIPHNYKESSFPVAVFTFTLKNTGETAADATVLFTWENSVGGTSGLTSNHINKKMRIQEGGIHSVLLNHKTANGQPSVTWAIAAQETEDVHVSECPCFLISGKSNILSAKDMWNEIKENMSFDKLKSDEKPLPSETGSAIGAAIAASVNVPSRSSRTITFSVAWDSPEVRFYGGKTYNRRYTKFYGTHGNAAASIARDAILEHEKWEREIEKWQRPILEDRRLPEWYPITLFNELYYLNAGGTIWTDGSMPIQKIGTIGEQSFSLLGKGMDSDTMQNETSAEILERMQEVMTEYTHQ